MTEQKKDPRPGPPFYITKEQETQLRLAAEKISPSLAITQATTFDEYARQLMVPPAVMELARKAADIRFTTWEIEGIRQLLAPETAGKVPLLRQILLKKLQDDPSHPPYIRVACTGKGDYDDLAQAHGYEVTHDGDYGSPVVLEIWPAQHYSPMHSHGDTTGIVYCIAGQLDVMSYATLDWNAEKRGLVTLTPGVCAWLTKDTYAVHKVYCPLNAGPNPTYGPNGNLILNDTGDFGASFHVYLNEDELSVAVGDSHSRDAFDYIDEVTHEKKQFMTYSDLSWRVLRSVLAQNARNWDR
ncbi:hypothetical protein AF335_05680 [Streptomyces eurocidicus]|uniref:Cysteine dioxygenase n=1 Tax=Streptomyces eurocidicus TaxID=66423 RepID=A0A2N8NZG0_STREU|nr:hypothetical protein [Streptomyces eurocidicus]MBB5120858.1 hypothetical protein [Streptomyces eurocidicus]MBF6054445.1 hypothetical protein [Streptomyces eurocidicus]PNE34150.1 hypothetical protein AF335_05680 [Streptomyces eurocidicus]